MNQIGVCMSRDEGFVIFCKMFLFYVKLRPFFWAFCLLQLYICTSVSLQLNLFTLGQVLCCLELGCVPLVKLDFHYFGRTTNRNIRPQGTCIETHWNNSFPMLTSRFCMFRMFFLFVVLHFLFLWWKWTMFSLKTNHNNVFNSLPIDYELLRTHIIQHIDRRKRLAPLLVVFLFSLDIRH